MVNKKDFGKVGNSDRFSSPSNTYKAKNGYIHIMAGSDDRFYGLVKAMNKKELFTNKIYNTPQKRIKNQREMYLGDIVVNLSKVKNKELKFLLDMFSKAPQTTLGIKKILKIQMILVVVVLMRVQLIFIMIKMKMD